MEKCKFLDRYVYGFHGARQAFSAFSLWFMLFRGISPNHPTGFVTLQCKLDF